MVLESLTTPEKAEKSPWEMLLLGMLYGGVAVILSLWIFREQSSIVLVLLTVIACLPLMHNSLKREEEKDDLIANESFLLKEHSKALSFYVFLFIGFVIAYSAAYIFLPSGLVVELFKAQTDTINKINANVAVDGHMELKLVESGNLFFKILNNNLRVFLFAIFFSFFYGAGSIFILTWNASVISAAMGNFFRTHLSDYATALGFAQLGHYMSIYGASILRYFVHGLPEILGYFIGALAGGIISVAVIRHDIGSPQFVHILKDSVDLIILGILILVVAGLLEVYVTPMIF